MKKYFLPTLLIAIIVGACIEVDMSVPSFPDMASTFGVGEGVIQRTITFNFLGFCLGALFYGPLSECFGRRKILLLGNVIMMAGALSCVYAPTVDLLLAARFIQGLGASSSVVLVFAIIADKYAGAEAFKLIGVVNAMISIFMSMAPSFGTYINAALGWRGNYGVVAGITGIGLVLMFFFLPETRTTREAFSMRKVVRDYGALLSDLRFVRAALVPSLIFASYMVFIACSAFLYLSTFGVSSRVLMGHLSAIVIAFAVVSALSGKIIPRLGGPDATVKVGTCLATASLAALTLLGRTPMATTALMCVFCAGFAVCYPIIFGRSLEIYPEIRGTASSLIMSIRSLLVSLFTAAGSLAFVGRTLEVAALMTGGVLVATTLALVRWGNDAAQTNVTAAEGA